MRPGPTFAYIRGKKLLEKKNENLAQIRFLFSCLFTCSMANLKSHCISSVMYECAFRLTTDNHIYFM